MSISVRLKGRALFDYTGNSEQRQISFNKGDVITITNQYQNGWWAGELNGSLGYFPATFVEVIDGSPDAASKQGPPKIPVKQLPNSSNTGIISPKSNDIKQSPPVVERKPPAVPVKQDSKTMLKQPSQPEIKPKQQTPPQPEVKQAKVPPPVVARNKLEPTSPITEKAIVAAKIPPPVESRPNKPATATQPTVGKPPPPTQGSKKDLKRSQASEADLHELDLLISQMESAAAELDKLLR